MRASLDSCATFAVEQHGESEGDFGMTGQPETNPSRACPWCSAHVPPGATRCPACGDAAAQREATDGLDIAGVTVVDPALAADAADPLRIPLSMTSSVDPIGEAINLTGMAELVAVAAIGHGSADAAADPSAVGTPSNEARRLVERLDGEDNTG
jgi:RNA polymerase subunit RPABC4/transcription elongation factor Spt4